MPLGGGMWAPSVQGGTALDVEGERSNEELFEDWAKAAGSSVPPDDPGRKYIAACVAFMRGVLENNDWGGAGVLSVTTLERCLRMCLDWGRTVPSNAVDQMKRCLGIGG